MEGFILFFNDNVHYNLTSTEIVLILTWSTWTNYFILDWNFSIAYNSLSCFAVLRSKRLRYYLKQANGTTSATQLQNKLNYSFLPPALLTRGRRSNSTEGKIYPTCSKKHERTSTQLRIYMVQKCPSKTSQSSVLKEGTNEWRLRSFEAGNIN